MEFRRSLLPISSVSLLGSCETRFMDAMTGKLYPTKAMKIGQEKHEAIARALPKTNKEDIIRDMKSGTKFGVRELPVTDTKFNLKGRIDQLDLTGRMANGRSEVIIIDDKFTRTSYESMPSHYKLQLAAYASAISNSSDYGRLCEVIGARLRCRRRADNSLLREFSVEREELGSWRANVPLAAKVAWVLYKKEREPEHRRIEVSTGEWGSCTCNGGRLLTAQGSLGISLKT